MNYIHPFFALIIFIIAYITAYVIQLKTKLAYITDRYETIDSLRGFLAIGVFISHASIWYQYIQTNVWDLPPSNLYAQFGQTGVAFFFMITSFLFISKLLNTNKIFNWRQFLISRIFRLWPMYLVSVFCIVLLIFWSTAWTLNVSPARFILQLVHTILFTIFRTPKINDFYHAYKVNADVTWSLPYEWLFYMTLPIIALLILKNKPPKQYLILGLGFIIAFCYFHGIEWQHILSFAGGVFAPFLLKYTNFPKHAKKPIFSFVILLCLIGIANFKLADNLLCKSFIAIVFTLIACGNTLFGLLKNSTLKFLGEICYSTYLMHGILLYALFYLGIGLNQAKLLSAAQYCIVVFALTPFLILISYWGFKWIEKPFMDKAKKIKL